MVKKYLVFLNVLVANLFKKDSEIYWQLVIFQKMQ